MSLHSILVFIRGARKQGYSTLVLTRGAWERGIVFRTDAHHGSLGMRLALYLYSILVLTKGAGERGYIALSFYYALVHTRGAWEQGKP